MAIEYMRTSVAYWTAKGERARSTSTAVAAVRPPSRRPTRQASGRQATEQTPEKARTAIVPAPKRRIQPWRNT